MHSTCFSLHEPFSGTSHYKNLKNVSTSLHAIVLLVRSHSILTQKFSEVLLTEQLHAKMY